MLKSWLTDCCDFNNWKRVQEEKCVFCSEGIFMTTHAARHNIVRNMMQLQTTNTATSSSSTSNGSQIHSYAASDENSGCKSSSGQGMEEAWDNHCKTSRLWRTSSRRDIRLHPGDNAGRSKIAQKFRSQSVQICGYVFHDTNGQNHGLTSKSQWYLLNEICTVTQSQAFRGKDNSRKFCWNLDGKMYRIGNVYLFIENNNYSYRYTWMTWKWLERNRIWQPCGRNWWKTLILTNQLHFLIAYTWDALNVNVNRTKQLFNSVRRSSLQERGAWNSGRIIRCILTIFWYALYLARIGRPDILWTVNKLARSVTKWTRACDRRRARLISYIHHTSVYRQYCHVGNTAQHCRLGLFHDPDFAGVLEDSKSTSVWNLCIYGSWTIVTISWMCKKQISVSHSSTESEVIALDAGLRMDGLPALDLWDVVIEMLRSSNSTKSPNNQARSRKLSARSRKGSHI